MAWNEDSCCGVQHCQWLLVILRADVGRCYFPVEPSGRLLSLILRIMCSDCHDWIGKAMLLVDRNIGQPTRIVIVIIDSRYGTCGVVRSGWMILINAVGVGSCGGPFGSLDLLTHPEGSYRGVLRRSIPQLTFDSSKVVHQLVRDHILLMVVPYDVEITNDGL